ncbi:type I restriction endonuclease subunit R [Clostridium sp. C8]|uniref:type I restriction endonuclease subunit R n=1 Tax=Clostridium sp. C8 TaxID=1667357 RepID=UPI00062E792D|nr:type I restriction endonuclease subunit R [Clostridium sp. C8]KLE17145.1 restriction endonuclease subunit R [Clostridium sp. C8]
MSYLGNEETLVELPAIEYLEKKLGYNFIHGKELIPASRARDSLTDVVLVDRLRAALKKINPWMNEENLDRAIRYISRADSLGTSLLEINEKIYDVLVNLTFTVEQDLNGDGQKKNQTVEFIDWENVDNNDFLVVRQFEVQTLSGKSIFPDIVIFINGIPVVVLEAKSPFLERGNNENIGKKEAFEQLRRYMNVRDESLGEGAPRLFYSNFFTGILNRYNAYVGTISSKYNHYLQWKDPYPFKKKEIENYNDCGQNIFIQGFLEKKNLLDLMRNFIVFEADNGSIIKKVCRYQQFRAVNKSIDRIEHGKDKLSRGGVIWHTQGSGKSLTMVFLAKKIKRTKGLMDSTIVVVTDRIDLDKQIFGTFNRTLSKITTPVRADKIEYMKNLLSNPQPQIIMTTIQKFQNEIEEKQVIFEGKKTIQKYAVEYPVLSTKQNIIVLADEAHRSQYKDTASNMRLALPNAVFIGFTGTPIDKEDKSTKRTFGEYIDKYSIKSAVDDGATVKIVYEGRRPDLQVVSESLEELFDEAFDDKSDEEKIAIKEKYANKRAVVESESRINDIVIDLLHHYKEQILPNGFKAQIVCVSREACVKYYNALNKHMKDTLGEGFEAKVIFSGKNNDPVHLKNHFTTKTKQDEIINRFKQPLNKDKLSFLIVKDMLLTGFDAPIEQVMYLDRPLKEHTLLQAIARVNRTFTREVERTLETSLVVKENIIKQCGYVVDYYGISNYLEEALAIFDKEELGKPMDSLDDLYNEMLDYRESIMGMFRGINKNDLDALVNKIEPEDKRAEFELMYKKFSGAVESLLPRHVDTDILNDLKWLSYIRAAAKAKFNPSGAIDISDCGEKVREIIENNLKSLGVKAWIAPITLFEKDFKAKINTLKSDEAKASAMEHAIKHTINIRMKENPAYYESLLERLRKILEETKINWIERKKRLEEFINNDVEQGAANEANNLGLDEKEFAFFKIVKKYLDENNNGEADFIVNEDGETYVSDETIELSKEIAKDVKNVVRDNYMIDWVTNPTKTNDIQRAIKLMLIKKYAKKLSRDVREKIMEPLLNLAKIHFDVLS